MSPEPGPSLGVFWDGHEIGRLEHVGEQSREYAFRYTKASRAISLSLPASQQSFTSAESRPFFEALLPEGPAREQIAGRLKLASSDSYGLLAELGRDCAGALQIGGKQRMSEEPSVRWLDDDELDAFIAELPRHPLGMSTEDRHLRLSLAGVQSKAVLVRDDDRRFGKPLDGMASSHILKPEPARTEFPGLAVNEYFCMRLATSVDLPTAAVELITADARPCLVVRRFDREHSSWPRRRLHQEDLCQALGLLPDFKYQRVGWRLPSYLALAELLDEHSPQPGLDRLAGARAAVFHFLVGNADAHAKNISLLHVDGVRLAPLYDVVSTAAYPELSQELSLSIGDELNPEAITSIHWSDLADDFGLHARAFQSARRQLVEQVIDEALQLQAQAQAQGWHHSCIDEIVDVIRARAPRVV
jgi:serine/threonine-protein kinase HipA